MVIENGVVIQNRRNQIAGFCNDGDGLEDCRPIATGMFFE